MLDQKVLFRITLWSLGVSAILGVFTVLTASFDVVGRVTVTALLTSAAAAVLWQAAIRLESSPLALVIAQAGALVGYLFLMCAIWNILDEVQASSTAFVFVGCLTTCATAIAAFRMPDLRYPGFVVATTSMVCGLLWLVGIWNGMDKGHVMETGLALAVWSAAAAICLVGFGTEPARHWRWVGVIAAVVGWGLVEYSIFNMDWRKEITDWLFVIGSVVVVVIHAVLCYASRTAPAKLPTRIIAIVAVVLTAALCDLIVLMDLRQSEFIFRVTIASAIIASASTIATAFIIQRGAKAGLMVPKELPESPRIDSAIATAFGPVKLECPKCHAQIEVPIGQSGCSYCGLKIAISVA